MSIEKAEAESGAMPTTSHKLLRDTGEMQDLYRRTLAASYASNDSELPADECIEDIFNGGDGWGRKVNRVTFQTGREGRESDGDSVSPKRASVYSRSISQDRPRGPDHRRKPSKTKKPAEPVNRDPQHSSSSEDHKRLETMRDRDLSEFDLREDLRSWHISPPR